MKQLGKPQLILAVHCPDERIKEAIKNLLEKKNKKSGKGRAHIILEALRATK